MTMRHIGLSFVLLISCIAPSCNAIKEIGQAATNLSRCSFKLDGVSDFQLAGISLSGKSNLGLVDGATVFASFAKNELPASFTLKVSVVNPNDGTGGTPRSAATLTGFAWKLRLDDTPTVSGDISSPLTIPGTGQSTIIPLRMNLDLIRFFKEKGFDQILNLALALGGAQGSASRITLRARPTISTDFGPISYPGEIDIIDKEFRGK
jgi:hypothetical protein